MDYSIEEIIIVLVITTIIIILATCCSIVYNDAFNPHSYQNETATIDSITQHDVYYDYDLNVSGSKISIKSVNYYNLTDKLSVMVQRGSGTGCIVNTVFINGVI